ncbi:chromosome segregation protein SMC [Clostridium formicaceticum]|uniref:Chromosome partition protein Smc n=1 Tax=Clostridium formicaceticum TaxID=1497 RepID=A0AAC9RLS0_9CLOT|nr:chromosome segregation protein SMC [Clostridium formicaceticum]AOY77343.1 chromosome segregation protein SMC [Clostridium formicaceticum]ARE87887.1 Chromosome partition protein Smc [Clostridium formicaceticum]
MYLKRLEIYGFKSFANKIEMNFEEGVTAVVGPNGSGKSNISDAIKWVLGEQSVKSLRGSKMEDVIFSGTSSKKPLSIAEVSLTLDNSSQILPVAYEEVTITRRMYRSGESEYYLNKSSCRLKDIRELFMDTGIGKEGYSVIGQGKIDEILSSKSEDRRQLFEEAAGIVKYKHRKHEAQKKLDNTKDNLTRLTDILQELEKQLKPLENQSIQAEKFKRLKEALLKLEVNLFIKEIDKTDIELKHIHQQVEMIKKSLALKKSEKETYKAQLMEVQKQITSWEEEIQIYQSEFHHTQNEIGRKEGEINLNQEKLMHLDQNKGRLKGEIDDIHKATIKNTQELEMKLDILKKVDTDIQDMIGVLENKTLEYKNLSHLSALKEQDMEKSKSYIIDALNDIADKKSEENSFKTLINTMQQRIEQVDKDKMDYRRKREEGQQKFGGLQQNLKEVTGVLSHANKEVSKITAEKIDLENQKKQAYKELESIKNEVNHKKSKKSILEEMEKGHDGYNKSVKNALRACEKDLGLGKGIYGVVANLLKVSKGYEIAIETALGPAIQNIVTRNEEDAKRLIHYLKKYNLGRVTLLPLTSIQKKQINQEELSLLKQLSNVEVAIDKINFNDEFSQIFSSLLSRVLIVPNLDVGTEAAKILKYKFKIVTMDGDVMNVGGALTGGSSAFKGNSILGRKRELEELSGTIEMLKKQEVSIQTKYDSLAASIDILDKKLKVLYEEQQENKILQATLESKIQQAQEENRHIAGLMRQMERETEELIAAKGTTLEQYTKIHQEIRNMEEKISETKHTLEDHEKHLSCRKQQMEILTDEITKVKINLASMKEQKKSILQEIENLQTLISVNEVQSQEREKEIIKSNREYEALQQQLCENKNQLQQFNQNLEILQNKLEKLKNDKHGLLQVQNQRKELLGQIEEVIKDLNDSIYKLDMKCTRLEMQQQTFYNKLWEEYELTYSNAKEIREDIPEQLNITKEIKALKDQIKDLGPINLQSIEDYKNVKERYEFLGQQKDDLEKAREALVKVIIDMEETMKKQFFEEFNKIKKNFNEVFVKLFAGGKAELILQEEKDLLSCGIEIIAQPPGKKLQSLSLLSGGERALTAIALLFGILLVKPTPFCILDEIEAALDDANVSRFAKFLQELSQETQFVVVTHRKGTMENADALYGVTMEEEGISKIVSVKLKNEIKKEIAS